MTIDTNAIKDAVLIFGDLAQQFIALTLKDSTRLISEIEQALNDNNPQAAGEAAHSLKSIMKQIDAQPVADYALKIEKAAKDGDVAACKQEWPPLQENYAIVREYLKSLTAQPLPCYFSCCGIDVFIPFGHKKRTRAPRLNGTLGLKTFIKTSLPLFKIQ